MAQEQMQSKDSKCRLSKTTKKIFTNDLKVMIYADHRIFLLQYDTAQGLHFTIIA